MRASSSRSCRTSSKNSRSPPTWSIASVQLIVSFGILCAACVFYIYIGVRCVYWGGERHTKPALEFRKLPEQCGISRKAHESTSKSALPTNRSARFYRRADESEVHQRRLRGWRLRNGLGNGVFPFFRSSPCLCGARKKPTLIQQHIFGLFTTILQK